MRLDFRRATDERRKALLIHFYSLFSWYLRPAFAFVSDDTPITTPYLVCT